MNAYYKGDKVTEVLGYVEDEEGKNLVAFYTENYMFKRVAKLEDVEIVEE